MLLVAEPLGAAQILRLADEMAHLERMSIGNSDRFPDRAMANRRLHLRHAELRKGTSTGCGGCGCSRVASDPDAAAEWPGWYVRRPT